MWIRSLVRVHFMCTREYQHVKKKTFFICTQYVICDSVSNIVWNHVYSGLRYPSRDREFEFVPNLWVVSTYGWFPLMRDFHPLRSLNGNLEGCETAFNCFLCINLPLENRWKSCHWILISTQIGVAYTYFFIYGFFFSFAKACTWQWWCTPCFFL